jgi:hypothetical protein
MGLLNSYKWHSYLQNNITQELEINQLHNKVYYDIHYLNHDIIVYYGYYGPLHKLSFKNKTEARRYIQMQLNYVQMDIDFFNVYEATLDSAYGTLAGRRRFVNRWKRVANMMKQKIIERKDVLESALLSPNISYRAFPLFHKKLQ